MVSVTARAGTSRDGRERTVVDLLLAADLVEVDDLDRAVGRRRSATGGSLKARWPFTPMPRQTMSIGAAASSRG